MTASSENLSVTRRLIDGLRALGRWTFVPFAIVMTVWPSLEFEVADDGAGTSFYGAPLPWNSDGLWTSLSKDYYLLPLAIDLAIYSLIGVGIMRLWARRRFLRSRATDAVIAISVWAGGVVTLAMTAAWVGMFAKYATPFLWYWATWTVIHVKFDVFAA